VYEKLLGKVVEQLETKPWPVRRLLGSALARVTESPPNRKETWNYRASAFLVKTALGERVKQSLGGRIRMLASGGASAPPALGRFFETVGIPFLSLYGMSETSGLICSQTVDHERDEGSVGLPSPDLELKIAENGELRVKGPLLMASYLESEDALDAMDEEGYFRTGDLVVLDPNNGQYHIVGRSKNLLVLSTGKKISPEPVETALEAVPPLTGVVVLGDGRPYVTALVFVPPKSLRALGANESAILSALNAIVRRALTDISEFERPKRLLVVPGSPSDWSEFVTPTLKLKRAPIIAAYTVAIERLYQLESGNGFILVP
jgi:long-chain acyl-CoA synthetase